MKRLFVLVYSAAAYLLFLAVSAWTIAWLVNVRLLGLPAETIDGAATMTPVVAIAVDLLLILGFGLQHSVMARPGFKRWWSKWVPPEVERSTYVLLASGFLLLLCMAWQPLPTVVWQVSVLATWGLWILCALGWAITVLASFEIDHFELFGLRQAWSEVVGSSRGEAQFAERGLYRWVRHPIMLGFMLAFWATPRMTVGHLLFTVAMTLYVLIALRCEERDLVRELGACYLSYQSRVPKLVPGLRWRKSRASLRCDEG
jgi:protein-S-isoprenylcysteine O-methyltransferase Ste14